MSELDDLRRVAYGRASGPDEEAAAAKARAALAQHDADEQRARAEREATEAAQSRAPDTELAPAADPDNASDDRVTLTLVDPNDEPGLLRRFTSSWRVWTVPAFAAFVIGIAITVASGLVILQASRTRPAQLVTWGEQVPALTPGDLAHASALLAREQKPEDAAPLLDSSIDLSTTHLLRAGLTNSVFAAMSLEGDICLIVIWDNSGGSGNSCSAPSDFALRGLMIASSAGDETTEVRWDGRTLTESRST